MKYSYNWLRELSGTKKSAEEVAELFLTHSFEVEGIEDLARGLDGVVVGEVLEVEKHPDADRLNVAKVNVGDKNGGELQIVCGAPNLRVGQKVPVALVGAKLIAKDKNDKEQEFNIKKGKIRGVESNGMICAEDELGLGNDHEGIMVLAETAEIGQNFAEYMELKDKVLDIDILPNRGHDCLSYSGVALELQALEGVKNIQDERSDGTSEVMERLQRDGVDGTGIEIKIDTPNCTRYAGIKIKNIKIKPSPLWMQARLKASGMNPINNIVDITNYVMLETNQPMHAFSAEGVNNITVRQATEGEKIKVLDEQELELTKEDIVITDGQKPIALAGVMGGLDSGIQDDTTEIILEGANFKSTPVRFTARNYNLLTDAAYRFERDIDPNFVEVAMSRAVELIQELAGGEVESVTDIYPEPVKSWQINLSLEHVGRLLGVKMQDTEIKNILERLGIGVKSQRFTPSDDLGSKVESQNSIENFSQTQKVLRALKEIKKTADKESIKFWVLGGLAIAFHFGKIYREHSDLDIITKNQSDHKKLLSILGQLGFRKIEEKKISDKLIGLVYKNDTEVEVLIGEYLGELGLVDSDFENKEKELIGVKALILSKRFLISVKEQQLKDRNKSKDKLDLQKINNSQFTIRNLLCSIPTRRRDLRTEEDLIEEVGRIYGYDKIKPEPIQAPVQIPHRNEQRFFERQLKNIAVANGFSETRGYSFHNEKDAEALGLKKLKHIELLNPASPEQAMLRNTLAISLLKAGRKSLSYFKEVRIFEIGRVYRDVDDTLPQEILSLAGGVFSKEKDGTQFYEIKGLLDIILEGFGINNYYYDPTSPAGLRGTGDSITDDERPKGMPNLHPSRQALLKTSSGKVLGWLGEIDKKTAKHFGLKNVRGAIFGIEVDKLREEVEETIAFEPLSKFPFVERDLSIVVGEKLRVGEVEDVLYKSGGELLQDVDLFDLYQNKETGERSMAFHLSFGDKEKTLQSKEIDDKITEIIKAIESELNVEVRK